MNSYIRKKIINTKVYDKVADKAALISWKISGIKVDITHVLFNNYMLGCDYLDRGERIPYYIKLKRKCVYPLSIIFSKINNFLDKIIALSYPDNEYEEWKKERKEIKMELKQLRKDIKSGKA